MNLESLSVNDYLASVSIEKQAAFTTLREQILQSLPAGFEECMQYKMISYVVPHSIYPKGYHCKPSDALPFISIAAQKKFIAFYHMGIYADKSLHDWFVKSYHEQCTKKLDMGKSCIRFTHLNDIPYALIGELVSKISPKDWVSLYEKSFVRKK